jgi:hypothetical protein
MGKQLNIFEQGHVIEVIHIEPTKEMPLEIFKQCYRFSMFSELMEHPTPTSVIYDEHATTIVAENMDEVLYQMIQDDMLTLSFCVPREWFEDALNEGE